MHGLLPGFLSRVPLQSRLMLRLELPRTQLLCASPLRFAPCGAQFLPRKRLSSSSFSSSASYLLKSSSLRATAPFPTSRSLPSFLAGKRDLCDELTAS